MIQASRSASLQQPTGDAKATHQRHFGDAKTTIPALHSRRSKRRTRDDPSVASAVHRRRTQRRSDSQLATVRLPSAGLASLR
nr:hypothetical protein CFP56_12587 [Quercus suber]